MDLDFVIDNERLKSGERSQWVKKRLATILLATDLQQNSRLALSYAASLTKFVGAELRSLYVFECGPHSQAVEVLDHVPSREREVGQESLEKFIADAGYPNVISEVVADETSVTSAIIKFLGNRSVDLLVIGTEGVHNGIHHLLLGSNTEALMLGSRRLILTVGPQVPAASEKELKCRRIVYISDFSSASISAATFAFALGMAFGVETEIYQVASSALRNEPLKLKRAATQFCELLRFADPDLPSHWFDAEFQLSRIVSEGELMETASQSGNLLVLGVQPASFLQRHLHTSLAYRLLTSAASPILTVPVEAAPRYTD